MEVSHCVLPGVFSPKKGKGKVCKGDPLLALAAASFIIMMVPGCSRRKV